MFSGPLHSMHRRRGVFVGVGIILNVLEVAKEVFNAVCGCSGYGRWKLARLFVIGASTVLVEDAVNSWT